MAVIRRLPFFPVHSLLTFFAKRTHELSNNEISS